jgi:hypothetical protein
MMAANKLWANFHGVCWSGMFSFRFQDCLPIARTGLNSEIADAIARNLIGTGRMESNGGID